MTTTRSDFFLFGATSELLQRLFVDERAWFLAKVRRLILVQRSKEAPSAYDGFERVVVNADVSNIESFEASLKEITSQHASPNQHLHVLPSYGRFQWNFSPKSPRFEYSADGLQVNLNCRLQIIEAFRPFAANTTFHLLGSLFANFPYTGDYAMGMWYINQLPQNPLYKDLDLRVYNLGGMKTRFWDHGRGGPNPFMHPELPTRQLREAIARDQRGLLYFYPTLASRIACFLGRRGVKVL